MKSVNSVMIFKKKHTQMRESKNTLEITCEKSQKMCVGVGRLAGKYSDPCFGRLCRPLVSGI